MAVRDHAALPRTEPEFSGMRVHCLGVGGIGMSGIARLLSEKGAIVSGCDTNDNSLCAQLREAGVRVFIGHDASHVKEADYVVVSSAVPNDNAEYAAAAAAGVPRLHRSQALAQLSLGHIFIAVAGTHGKTTTSSMLTVALEETGRNPSFVVGGIITGVGTNARYAEAAAGDPALFVAEADESDGSFLIYDVDIAVVTNVEADHLDHYGTAANVENAFEDFVRNVPSSGTVVMCVDDAGVQRLLTRLAADPAAAGIIGYGRRNIETLDPEITSMLREYYHMEAVPRADLQGTGMQEAWLSVVGGEGADKKIHVRTPLPGWHNVLNAAATFAVLQVLGVDTGRACDAIAAFPGVGRRFELKGEVNGIKIYDDYAHHPTEVRAVLNSARDLAGDCRLHVIFQPHLYSRTRDFAPDLAQALDRADRVLVLDIYGAREDPIPGVTSELIVRRMEHTVNDDPEFVAYSGAKDLAAVGVQFVAAAKPGDIVMTIGAGNVTQLGPILLEYLARGLQR